MRKTIVLLLAVTALAIGTAHAQSLRPDTPHMFRWTPERQAEWYPAIETLYRSATIKRGDYVHPLPKADRTLTVRYKDRYGNAWNFDDHVKAYNVSGLMVAVRLREALAGLWHGTRRHVDGRPGRSRARRLLPVDDAG